MTARSFRLGLFALLFVLMTGCKGPAPEKNDLAGTWITPDPQYAGRYIEFNDTMVIFGTGTGDPNMFFIEKIKQNRGDEYVEWIFHCRTDEDVSIDIVLFYHVDENGSYFELRNKRKVQWRKQ